MEYLWRSDSRIQVLEYGIVMPQGIRYIRNSLPDILEDGENLLSVIFREQLRGLYDEMVHLDEKIDTLELRLKTIGDQNEDCKRLLSVTTLIDVPIFTINEG